MEIGKYSVEVICRAFINNPLTLETSHGINLRFPIFVENRTMLVKFLKKHKVFISDIWYDSVAPECPSAVEISKNILNLPTHINVSKNDALKIAGFINIWLKSQ